MVRLNQHLLQNRLYEIRSANKQNCSNETPLFKVHNNQLMAHDTPGGTVLFMRYLTAAFDSMDHTILLDWRHQLGIRDGALDRSRSYLSQRRQVVVIKGAQSSYQIRVQKCVLWFRKCIVYVDDESVLLNGNQKVFLIEFWLNWCYSSFYMEQKVISNISL